MSATGGGRPPLPTWESESTTVVENPAFADAADAKLAESPDGPTAHDTVPPEAVRAPGAERPPIEVEVRRVSGANLAAKRTHVAYEIWTKNRVYGLDSSLNCIEVIDLASGRSDSEHAFIGAQLVGGQQRTATGNELTFPLPTPGSEAVFQALDQLKRMRLSITSTVTRVILHVHRVEVGTEQRDRTWDTIASSRTALTLKSPA
jgi:hypothetical protein